MADERMADERMADERVTDEWLTSAWLTSAPKYRVAIIRDMTAAMYATGFEPWGVHVRPAERSHHAGAHLQWLSADGSEGAVEGY